jgi:hypothetical protein
VQTIQKDELAPQTSRMSQLLEVGLVRAVSSVYTPMTASQKAAIDAQRIQSRRDKQKQKFSTVRDDAATAAKQARSCKL